MPRLTRTLLGATLLAASAAASAQSPGPPRYTPATPTTSRYLNLLQDTGGVASNYYGVVRPLQRASAHVAQQQLELQSQQARIDRLNADLNRRESETAPTPTGQRSWFFTDSSRAAYGNRSHYYFRWEDRRLPPRR